MSTSRLQGASNFFHNVAERARARAQAAQGESSAPENKGDEKQKGLEFMALRFNVVHRRRHLQVSKQITPTEYFLLEEIELATIGGQNHKSTMAEEMDIEFKALAFQLDIPINRLYATLKSLEQKFLIIRKPSRYRGMEIIGLNPKEFGLLLTNKVAEMQARRKILKVVPEAGRPVDKSPPPVDKSKPEVHPQSLPSTAVVDPMYRSCTSGIQPPDINPQNSCEIIEEKRPLESFKSLSRGFKEGDGGGELHSHIGEQAGEPDPSNRISDLEKEAQQKAKEHEIRVRTQLAEIKKQMGL